MKSTVAALCLLFVTSFLGHESEPGWREAVARAALANGVSAHAVAVERARCAVVREKSVVADLGAPLYLVRSRANSARLGSLPPPRAPTGWV